MGGDKPESLATQLGHIAVHNGNTRHLAQLVCGAEAVALCLCPMICSVMAKMQQTILFCFNVCANAVHHQFHATDQTNHANGEHMISKCHLHKKGQQSAVSCRKL